MVSPSQSVRDAIEGTVRGQAHANERAIAGVRVLNLSVAVLFQWVSFVWTFAQLGFPTHTPLWLATLTTTWWAVAVGLLVALRRGWYARWLPYVVPLVDGVLLVVLHAVLADTFGTQPGVAVAVPVSHAMACALLAASAALRLAGRAAAWTAGCAWVAMVVGFVAFAELPRWALLFTTGSMAALCLLVWWLSRLVTRAVRSEVGKATLRRFLPAGVVDGAHEDPLGLVETPRVVDATILVSDLRGFTALSERLPPAEVLTLLNELQGAFARVIATCGGTVDKFMGDGMLAVFGAPLPLPDHAARGVEAARGLLVALAEVNAARLARGQAAVGMGVGVHTGAVIAGCLGGAERLEFTVLGDAVNTASRLESMTKAHGVELLISADVVAALPSSHGLRPLGEVTLRGRAAPTAVYTA